MHPGPGEPRGRAVRGGDRVAAGADHRAGRAPGWWCAWRSSTSCCRAAAREPPARRRSRPWSSRHERPLPAHPHGGSRRGARDAAPAGRAAARPACRPRRRPRPAGARRRDRRDHGAGRGERAGGLRAGRGRGPDGASRASSTLMSTSALPGARTRRTSSRARARRRPAGSARSSRCRTPSPSWTRRPCCARSRSGLPSRLSCRSASSPRSPRASPGTELTEMAELAQEGAAGFSDDGFPVADAHRMRQALQYQRLAGLVLALHEEDPALSGHGCDARGRGLDDARGGGHPVRLREHGDRARCPAGPLRGWAHPHPAPVRRGVGRGGRARARGRACRSRPRSPRTTWR